MSLNKIKKVLIYIGAFVVALIIFIPLILLLLSLRSKGKTISFTPEFKIIDIKNSNEEDLELSKKTIKKAKDIQKKIK